MLIITAFHKSIITFKLLKANYKQQHSGEERKVLTRKKSVDIPNIRFCHCVEFQLTSDYLYKK